MAAPPFAITNIDHLLLLIDGMERNLAFYKGVLGCVVESRIPRFGMAELRAGVSQIDLVDIATNEGAWARSDVAGGRNIDHFALAIDHCDVENLRDHLKARNVAIVEEREEDGPTGKSLSLYVRDPSGNTIELLLRQRL